MTAAVTRADLHGHIRQVVDKIEPAVAAAQAAHRKLHGTELVPAAIEANVWYSIEELLTASPLAPPHRVRQAQGGRRHLRREDRQSPVAW